MPYYSITTYQIKILRMSNASCISLAYLPIHREISRIHICFDENRWVGKAASFSYISRLLMQLSHWYDVTYYIATADAIYMPIYASFHKLYTLDGCCMGIQRDSKDCIAWPTHYFRAPLRLRSRLIVYMMSALLWPKWWRSTAFSYI